MTDTQGFSDWDRFAQTEYFRLSQEDENAENVNHIYDSLMIDKRL
jgi:hypothetical protein